MLEGEGVRRLRQEVQQCLSNAERAMSGQQPSYTNGHAATNGSGEFALLPWHPATCILTPHHLLPFLASSSMHLTISRRTLCEEQECTKTGEGQGESQGCWRLGAPGYAEQHIH